MKILLTNDDGIESASLHMLQKRLEREHEVWIMAPDRERSGCSHSISTINRTVRVIRKGNRSLSCEGTPADCVLLACLGMVPDGIDMVISGINYGPNLGTDIVYSGTVAAARQGAFMKKPSIAASLCSFKPPYYFEHAVEYLAAKLEFLRETWVPDSFINLNFPNVDRPQDDPEFTKPSRRIYEDWLNKKDISENEWDVGIFSKDPGAVLEPGTDYSAVHAGKISLSLVKIYPESGDIHNKTFCALTR